MALPKLITDLLTDARADGLWWEAGVLALSFALGLMVVSAVIPMMYFRKRGWLK